MATFGMVPMLVKVTFTCWPAATSKWVALNFMLSLAVSSISATAEAAAGAAVVAVVAGAEGASSFLPQAVRAKAPPIRVKTRYFFMVRQPNTALGAVQSHKIS